jgi:hypothetical protein
MAESIKNKCGDMITVGEAYTLDQRIRMSKGEGRSKKELEEMKNMRSSILTKR